MVDAVMAQAVPAALQNFLALSDDREKLIRSCVPNYGSFYWSDAYTRGLGKEVFGL